MISRHFRPQIRILRKNQPRGQVLRSENLDLCFKHVESDHGINIITTIVFTTSTTSTATPVPNTTTPTATTTATATATNTVTI